MLSPADGEAAIAEGVNFSLGDAGRFQTIEQIFDIAEATESHELPAGALGERRLDDGFVAERVFGRRG